MNFECPLDKLRKRSGTTFAYWLQKISEEDIRPELSECIPEQIRTMLTNGWSTDPAHRPSAQYMLNILDICANVVDGKVPYEPPVSRV